MNEALRHAMAPVLRDLRAAGITAPRIEDDDWTGDPGQPSAMLKSSDGSAAGVSVSLSEPECERVAAAADQVQDWAIEELWGSAPTNWPRCPRHPDNHPMAAICRDEVAVWACPADSVTVCEIGKLSAVAEPPAVG